MIRISSFFVFIAALSFITLILTWGVPANAQTLETILKDKNIITAEEYQAAVKKNDPVYYQPGKGITLESRDGNWSSNIGGRLQLRYTYEELDEAKDVGTFSIRRARLWTRGHLVTPKLGYYFQGSFAGENAELLDATITYKFFDPFTLSIGQMKPPQARQELTSSGSQLFIDRSLANDTFNLGYDQGLAAKGSFVDERIAYYAGIFNGNGLNTANPNTNYLLAGRIDINPLGNYKTDEAAWASDKPLLNIGFSYATENMTLGDIGEMSADNDVLDKALNIDGFDDAAFLAAAGEELKWDLWTVDLFFTWFGAVVGGEYYHLNADPATGGSWAANGYYLQAAYQVVPKTLELALRYSAIDSTEADASEKFEKSQTQVGINYYLSKHNAKIQADFTRATDDRKDTDDNIFRLQAQVNF